ncbi:MAG: hypothetical protein WCG25_03290 [bacterium]
MLSNLSHNFALEDLYSLFSLFSNSTCQACIDELYLPSLCRFFDNSSYLLKSFHSSFLIC